MAKDTAAIIAGKTPYRLLRKYPNLKILVPRLPITSTDQTNSFLLNEKKIREQMIDKLSSLKDKKKPSS